MVYLIGAGPGNPELITVKGLRLLQKCDAVIYDRLLSEELLSVVSENCHKIYVGKKPMSHAKKQEEINEILIQTAKQYKNVVRLKGGDPFVKNKWVTAFYADNIFILFCRLNQYFINLFLLLCVGFIGFFPTYIFCDSFQKPQKAVPPTKACRVYDRIAFLQQTKSFYRN